MRQSTHRPARVRPFGRHKVIFAWRVRMAVLAFLNFLLISGEDATDKHFASLRIAPRHFRAIHSSPILAHFDFRQFSRVLERMMLNRMATPTDIRYAVYPFWNHRGELCRSATFQGSLHLQPSGARRSASPSPQPYRPRRLSRKQRPRLLPNHLDLLGPPLLWPR
jgi:hypothetical protein